MGRCCCRGCQYFADDYGDGSYAENWTVASPAWSEAGGVLSTASANARIDCNKTHPDASSNVSASVTFKTAGRAAGDKIRLELDDGNVWAEVEVGAGANGTGRLFVGGSQIGGDVAIGGAGASGGVDVTLTLSTNARACFENIDVSTEHAATSSVVSLATATLTGTATFDDFTLNKTYLDSAKCPQPACCECTACTTGSLPDQVSLKAENWGPEFFLTSCGGCASYNQTAVLDNPNCVPLSDCPITDSGADDLCAWQKIVSGSCGDIGWEVHLSEVGGEVYAWVVVHGDTIPTASWKKHVGTSPIDCGESGPLAGLTLTYDDFQDGPGDFTTYTCGDPIGGCYVYAGAGSPDVPAGWRGVQWTINP